MKKIVIKNLNEAFLIDDIEGAKIESIYMDNDIPNSQKIRIKGWRGTKGDIKYIFNEGDRKDYTDQIKKYNQEFFERKKQMLSLPPEERAKNFNIFSLIWWIYTDKKTASKDILEKVVDSKFFQENPGRMYPNPAIFKEITPTTLKSKSGKEWQHISDVLRKSALRFVEEAIKSDKLFKV